MLFSTPDDFGMEAQPSDLSSRAADLPAASQGWNEREIDIDSVGFIFCSLGPKRTRISHLAKPKMATYAAFLKVDHRRCRPTVNERSSKEGHGFSRAVGVPRTSGFSR
jgi:hypothetical protein